MTWDYRTFVRVHVAHAHYASAGAPELSFEPAPASFERLARRGLLFKRAPDGFLVAGEVQVDSAGNESPPHSIDEGDRVVVCCRADPSLLSVSDLPLDGRGAYSLLNRSGTDRLCAGTAVGAADLLIPPPLEVRGQDCFLAIVLTAPAGGWPLSETVGGATKAKSAEFQIPFAARALAWRYHVVLREGDTDTSSLAIAYAPPAGSPYPPGITFHAGAVPPDVASSFPGRAIKTFVSSAPLPILRAPLQKTALTRGVSVLVSDLPNPPRSPPWSADAADVVIQLR